MNVPPELEAKILATPGATILYQATDSKLIPITEKQFMAQVIQMAKRHGWRTYHTHDSRRSARGFPDLVLVRERLVMMELKVGTNKPTNAQHEWADALRTAGVSIHTFYPEHWSEIEELLR